MKTLDVLSWYEQSAKSLLEKHAPDRVPAIDADYERLKRLLARPDEVTICFLGNSGVGKSTLLNALAAGARLVLPSGGTGPLTAQATEVRYSEESRFRVVYHPKRHLWQLAFALEARLKAGERVSKKAVSTAPEGSEVLSIAEVESELANELSAEEIKQAMEQAHVAPSTEGIQVDALDGYVKQAKNIVCGNQFAEQPLSYLVDGLRLACGVKNRWGSILDPLDQARVERVEQILKSPKQDRTYERREGTDPQGFLMEMTDHAAGFLSPLIERIEVGWPSDLLKCGVVLVDLPGVGVSQDAYRDVTASFIKEKARAIIITVDRAGQSEATIDLLRTSGYWERMVGASDDPTSDACAMLIAVTRVDDITQTTWSDRVAKLAAGQPKPKKREVFAELVEEFKPRMKMQVAEQLSKIGETSNDSVNEARNVARKVILDSMEIHPVSAPELRKIILDDEDDRPFLSTIEETGIPRLTRSLEALAASARQERERSMLEVSERLALSIHTELKLIESAWQQETRAEEEAVRLENALKPVLDEKKGEYRARAAGFRTYLDETVPAKIEALVLEARAVAEEEVSSYLQRLRGAHWATLRAAVRRGGAFHGSRIIHLPEDITGYFQEPMAAVWGQKLLRDMRKRTTELSTDTVQIVGELIAWANENGGVSINKKLLVNQQERITALAEQMKTVGKEAVDELRATVKEKLAKAIQSPIKNACDKFVREGDDIGPGVKYRILELFSRLAKTATDSAKGPAIQILKDNAARVRADIQSTLQKAGDPIEETAGLIVQRHEDHIRRSDAQKKSGVLREIRSVLDNYPGPLKSETAGAEH